MNTPKDCFIYKQPIACFPWSLVQMPRTNMKDLVFRQQAVCLSLLEDNNYTQYIEERKQLALL